MSRIIVNRATGETIEPTDGEVSIHEAEPLSIEFRTARDFVQRPEVLLDGYPIGPAETIPDGSSLIWRWPFCAEHWCGRTNLERLSGGDVKTLTLNSVPSGTKYSPDEYDQMLERLRAYGADLDIGLAPGTEEAAPTKVTPLRATHPAVIDHYLADLLRQLARILREPVRRLRPVEQSEPYLQARRASTRTISWLAAHPAQHRRLMGGDLSTVISTSRRDESLDHPANRYLVSLLRRLRQSFRTTADALVDFNRNPWNGDLERRRAEHLANRVRDATRRVDAAAADAFFVGLPAGELTETVSQVYARHPQCGRFARGVAHLLDPALSVGRGGDLAASLRRSYDLFELYCLHKLVADLQRGLAMGWRSRRASRHISVLSTPASGPFWIAQGPAGERRVVYYQQRFSTIQQDEIAVSGMRRPDFRVADYLSDGTLRRWVILDAKYRTARDSIHDALKDLHVYRDSLRVRCPVTGQPTRCEAGYLLVS